MFMHWMKIFYAQGTIIRNDDEFSDMSRERRLKMRGKDHAVEIHGIVSIGHRKCD